MTQMVGEIVTSAIQERDEPPLDTLVAPANILALDLMHQLSERCTEVRRYSLYPPLDLRPRHLMHREKRGNEVVSLLLTPSALARQKWHDVAMRLYRFAGSLAQPTAQRRQWCPILPIHEQLQEIHELALSCAWWTHASTSP
jgi:hypothetical protein